MDRFNIIIKRQEQLEAPIREWGFLPLFPLKDTVEGRTPKQSRKRIIDYLQGLFPDV